MKTLLSIFLLVSAYTVSLAQQSLKETMGFYNGRENTIPEFEAIDGFDLDELTYSGSGMQGANHVSRSTGYTGASSYPHVYLTSSQTFIMKGIIPSAPCSTATTTVSFGTAMTSSFTNNLVLLVSYSTDGGTNWAAPTSFTATTSWVLQSVSVPGNTNAIRFQSANISFFQEFIAIDDVTISTTGAGCASPDLTPIIYARPSSTYGTTNVSLVVDVTELNSAPTSGTVTVYVTKDSKSPLTFSPTATSVNNRPVQNSVWSFDGTSNGSFYILTTTQGIEADGVLSFGLRGVLSPGATKGVLTLSAIVDDGSGGETKNTNNSDADKVNYFAK